MSLPRVETNFKDLLVMRCANDADSDDLRRAADLLRNHGGLANRMENLAWTLDRIAGKGSAGRNDGGQE